MMNQKMFKMYCWVHQSGGYTKMGELFYRARLLYEFWVGLSKQSAKLVEFKTVFFFLLLFNQSYDISSTMELARNNHRTL